MAKSIQTVVLSCNPVQTSPSNVAEFEVELEDTVIFPTGGGQPHDTGIIKIMRAALDGDGSAPTVNVLRCERRGLRAIHFVDRAISPESLVEVTVDWAKRWDHMQQHSGQHIISDLAETIFSPPWITYGWNMGPAKSFVEFENVSPTQSQLDELEMAVNNFILSAHPMVLEESILQAEATERPDSLPSDIQSGVVRVIRFGDFGGPCCGTHVSNSGQIQMVKLLTIEKVRGGNSRVWFAAGNRILDLMSKTLTIEKNLNNLLSCAPCEFADRVAKKLGQIKDLMKENKKLNKELKSTAK